MNRLQPRGTDASALFLFLVLYLLSTVQSVVAQNTPSPPWLAQTFEYWWEPSNSSVTQCRSLDIAWGPRGTSKPVLKPPFTFLIWEAGETPYTVNLGSGMNYTWKVNIPTGGPYLTTMFDSNGATGGSADSFNVIADPTTSTPSCTIINLPPKTLGFTIGNSLLQCATVPMFVTGGTAPYTLRVLPENYPPKTVHYSSANFNYILDVPAGTTVFFAVQDAAGLGAVGASFVVGSSPNTACLTAASTLSPGAPELTTVYPGIAAVTGTTTQAMIPTQTASAGGLQGGAIAGIVIACILIPVLIAGGLVWLMCFHRRPPRRRTIETIDGTPAGPRSPVTYYDPYTYGTGYPMEFGNYPTDNTHPPRNYLGEFAFTTTQPIVVVPESIPPTPPEKPGPSWPNYTAQSTSPSTTWAASSTPIARTTTASSSRVPQSAHTTTPPSPPTPETSPRESAQLLPVSSQERHTPGRRRPSTDHSPSPGWIRPDPQPLSQSYLTASASPPTDRTNPLPPGAAPPNSFLRLLPLTPDAMSSFRLSSGTSTDRAAPSTPGARTPRSPRYADAPRGGSSRGAQPQRRA
ncbi:hypothetical protein FRB99_004405 [Tulasnella sp. 403]|nr:hypothetical protein FRB99_004405 [Tulasnella sp. 403]